MKRFLAVLVLALVLAFCSYSARASGLNYNILLPLIQNSNETSSGNASIEAYTEFSPTSGLLETVPLDNDTLLVLTITETNFVVYTYTGDSAQTFLDSWSVGSYPTKIDVAGCVWVTSEDENGFIVVHRIQLPVDVGCEGY